MNGCSDVVFKEPEPKKRKKADQISPERHGIQYEQGRIYFEIVKTDSKLKKCMYIEEQSCLDIKSIDYLDKCMWYIDAVIERDLNGYIHLTQKTLDSFYHRIRGLGYEKVYINLFLFGKIFCSFAGDPKGLRSEALADIHQELLNKFHEGFIEYCVDNKTRTPVLMFTNHKCGSCIIETSSHGFDILKYAKYECYSASDSYYTSDSLPDYKKMVSTWHFKDSRLPEHILE